MTSVAVAYVRFGLDSDVAMICTTDPEERPIVECFACMFGLPDEDNPIFRYKKHLDLHLKAHVYAGHKVPPFAFQNVRNDDWLRV